MHTSPACSAGVFIVGNRLLMVDHPPNVGYFVVMKSTKTVRKFKSLTMPCLLMAVSGMFVLTGCETRTGQGAAAGAGAGAIVGGIVGGDVRGAATGAAIGGGAGAIGGAVLDEQERRERERRRYGY